MSIRVNRSFVAVAAVAALACWTAALRASPMPSMPAPLAGGASWGSADLETRALPPGAVPGWSLRNDLQNFYAASVLTAPPPAKPPVRVVAGARSADAGPDPLALAVERNPPQPAADTLPEPASALVLAIGLAGLFSLRRPKRPEVASQFSSAPVPRADTASSLPRRLKQPLGRRHATPSAP